MQPFAVPHFSWVLGLHSGNASLTFLSFSRKTRSLILGKCGAFSSWTLSSRSTTRNWEERPWLTLSNCNFFQRNKVEAATTEALPVAYGQKFYSAICPVSNDGTWLSPVLMPDNAMIAWPTTCCPFPCKDLVSLSSLFDHCWRCFRKPITDP